MTRPPNVTSSKMDGIAKSEYCVFVSTHGGLQLKQEFPNSAVKLRDADETAHYIVATEFFSISISLNGGILRA